jgi:6-phosphogluconolactonase
MRARTKGMTLSNIGKWLLAATSTAGIALAITSCGASNTVDVVYVTSNKLNPGQINAYYLDSETGNLRQLVDSPYPSGGRNPVYEVTSPNGLNLYVANHDDNTIVRFAIGTDGKLYPLQTVNTPGTEPVSLAINSSGTDLYVLDYYAPASPGQPSYTDLNPGPGAVIVLPLDASTGAMGAALTVGVTNYFEVQCFPTSMTLTPDGNYLFVTDTNAVVVTTSPPVTGTVPTLPAGCPNSGTVAAYSMTGGVPNISPATTGTPASPSFYSTGAGSEPTGITADPNSSVIYVTDAALNLVYTYSISGGTIARTSSAITGTMPMGALVAGNFLYVANYNGGTLSSYSLSSGVPVPLATTTSAAPGPLCLMLDPDVGRFLYTTNYIGGTVGGAEFNPSTGALVQNQGSPYITSGQPTCIASVKQKQGNANGL